MAINDEGRGQIINMEILVVEGNIRAPTILEKSFLATEDGQGL